MPPSLGGKRSFVKTNDPAPASISYCERFALSVHPVSMIVCVCNAIRESEVREAARDGASCPTSAYGRFGRKPRCGQCFPFARQIIAEAAGA
jgi:bacterioferritin-associated ferredoxin